MGVGQIFKLPETPRKLVLGFHQGNPFRGYPIFDHHISTSQKEMPFSAASRRTGARCWRGTWAPGRRCAAWRRSAEARKRKRSPRRAGMGGGRWTCGSRRLGGSEYAHLGWVLFLEGEVFGGCYPAYPEVPPLKVLLSAAGISWRSAAGTGFPGGARLQDCLFQGVSIEWRSVKGAPLENPDRKNPGVWGLRDWRVKTR